MKIKSVYCVLYDYEKKEEDELSVKDDDLVLEVEDTRYSTEEGWILVRPVSESMDDQEVGIIPAGFVKEALYALEKCNEDELSFREGDLLSVYYAPPNGTWWIAKLGTEIGLVPSNYLNEEDKCKHSLNDPHTTPSITNTNNIAFSDEFQITAGEDPFLKYIEATAQPSVLSTEELMQLRTAFGATLIEGRKKTRILLALSHESTMYIIVEKTKVVFVSFRSQDAELEWVENGMIKLRHVNDTFLLEMEKPADVTQLKQIVSKKGNESNGQKASLEWDDDNGQNESLEWNENNVKNESLEWDANYDNNPGVEWTERKNPNQTKSGFKWNEENETGLEWNDNSDICPSLEWNEEMINNESCPDPEIKKNSKSNLEWDEEISNDEEHYQQTKNSVLKSDDKPVIKKWNASTGETLKPNKIIPEKVLNTQSNYLHSLNDVTKSENVLSLNPKDYYTNEAEEKDELNSNFITATNSIHWSDEQQNQSKEKLNSNISKNQNIEWDEDDETEDIYSSSIQSKAHSMENFYEIEEPQMTTSTVKNNAVLETSSRTKLLNMIDLRNNLKKTPESSKDKKSTLLKLPERLVNSRVEISSRPSTIQTKIQSKTIESGLGIEQKSKPFPPILKKPEISINQEPIKNDTEITTKRDHEISWKKEGSLPPKEVPTCLTTEECSISQRRDRELELDSKFCGINLNHNEEISVPKKSIRKLPETPKITKEFQKPSITSIEKNHQNLKKTQETTTPKNNINQLSNFNKSIEPKRNTSIPKENVASLAKLTKLPFIQKQQISNISRKDSTVHSIRLWTDRSGAFSTEAVFIKYEDGKIFLRKSNGINIAVPIDTLSPNDIDHLKSFEESLVSYNPTSYNNFDWMKFLTTSGIPPNIAITYAQCFVKEKMDSTSIPYIDRSVLKSFGMAEGDIIKIKKTCELYLDHLTRTAKIEQEAYMRNLKAIEMEKSLQQQQMVYLKQQQQSNRAYALNAKYPLIKPSDPKDKYAALRDFDPLYKTK